MKINEHKFVSFSFTMFKTKPKSFKNVTSLIFLLSDLWSVLIGFITVALVIIEFSSTSLPIWMVWMYDYGTEDYEDMEDR